ncbi:YL1 nuclear protein-domain-containing protein [Coniella lustricola]|uniref:YL1 nuclear protein-domain-containing protein n=1 Tax=Coniella lustricola TaxID=2025994 RepID=A0A2T3AFK2_9PEZI|nr:YL1 nuclear protein-domain-containing protein [Coniella lustricola]
MAAAKADVDTKTTQSPPPPPLPTAATEGDSDASSSDSDSESGAAAAPAQIEWLATGRAKRSTAGNRMKSMLANETPADEDSDLELLFQEDEDDAGFTDKEDGEGSDVQMDSSDDDDAENEANADELAGEKELERQAKEKKLAARKRKAQEAIPAKFRKKVRISQPATATPTGGCGPASASASAPAPRPKKKSERASWLPTEADMPTRASERKTTRLSKEQLHQQMIEREVRRKKQVEAMERKAKKLEAMKKPPMTQAERLVEAAVVEKRNAKSLNRWEEAEKLREEERRAKLAALHNRRLEGPVVSFWTGIVDLSEVQLKHVGKMVSMEEKPKRKRPSTAVSAAAAPSKAENEAIPPATTEAASAVLKTELGLPDAVASTPVAPHAPVEAPVAAENASVGPNPTEPQTPALIPAEATITQAGAPVSTSSVQSPAASTPSAPTAPGFTPLPPASTAPQLPTSSLSATAPLVPTPAIPAPSASPSPAMNSPTTVPSASALPASVAPPATTEAAISPAAQTLPSFTTSASLTPRPISPAIISKPGVPINSSGITIPPIPLTTASPSPAPLAPLVKTETQTPKSLPLALRLDARPRFMPPPNPHLAQTTQFSGLAPPAGVPSVLNGPLPVLGYAAPRVPRAPGYAIPVPPSPSPSPSPFHPPLQISSQVSHTPPPQPLHPPSRPSSQPSLQQLPPQQSRQAPSPTPPSTAFQAPLQPLSQSAPQPISGLPAQTNPISRPSPPIPLPVPIVTPVSSIPKLQPSSGHTTASFEPIPALAPPAKVSKKQQSDQTAGKKASTKSTASRKPPPPPEPPEPEMPMEGKVTRSCIILQDFDDDAVKKPEVQTQILFGRRMTKLGKPPQPPLCVITNHPARYRDPKTGLPFYNAHAFKEIQKLIKGDFRWSQAMGTWVGKGEEAAKGVPTRFLRPETEEERKERLERKEQEKKKLAEETEKGTADAFAKEASAENPKAALPAGGISSMMPDSAADIEFAPERSLSARPASIPAHNAMDLMPSVPTGVPVIMPSPDAVKPTVEMSAPPPVPPSEPIANPAEDFEMFLETREA